MSLPKNLILYGPPGTGKTRATVTKALEIFAKHNKPEKNDSAQNTNDKINSVPSAPSNGKQDSVPDDYKEQLRIFNDLVETGYIKFVTFHQSFSYEDFVEGIRAEVGGDNAIRYRVTDGIFKELCNHKDNFWMVEADAISSDAQSKTPVAMGAYLDKIDPPNVWLKFYIKDPEQATNDYDKKVFNKIRKEINQLQDMHIGDWIIIFKDKVIKDYGRAIKKPHFHRPDKGNSDMLEYEIKVQMQSSPTNIGNVNLSFFNQNNDKSQFLYKFCPTENDIKLLKQELINNDFPLVIIIDEINRGNISRIFGELITLIEESHRANPEKKDLETLSVTLPYSREKFTIPDNVYIIGTMNTADRSLTGLDIALRRRFNFEEMGPDIDALKDIKVNDLNIADLLKSINQRIEVMLDRDHCIGHALFIPLKFTADDKKMEKLGEIFKKNIIPLLQEYFFEDWGKIHAVLYGQNKNISDDKNKIYDHHLIIPKVKKSLDVPQEYTNKSDLWQINEGLYKDFETYNQMLAPKDKK